jgi:hypothetical protein
MKFDEWFIRGWGLNKTIKKIEKLKQLVKNKAEHNKEQRIIYSMRMELYQIIKHQKLLMRQVFEIEKLFNKK